ncbi:MAG: CHAD domain-containing protein [Candidatus Nanopelagicales bacterium]
MSQPVEASTLIETVGAAANAAPIEAVEPETGFVALIQVPEPSTPDQPASFAIRGIVAKYAKAFALQDQRVRRDEPDSVHQMRVAARKLRSALKAFKPLFDEQWAEELRTELGWAAGELGAARDTEVIAERLARHAGDLNTADAERVQAALAPYLEARELEAREHAMSFLDLERHDQLLNTLVKAAENPKLTSLAELPAREVLPELVTSSFRKLERQVHELRMDGPAEAWHKARITAKRVRYSADALKVVFGGPAQRLDLAMSEITDILGDHQDACIAQDLLKELAGTEGIDGPTGFSLGLAHEREYETEIHDRTEFERVWPEIQRIFRHTQLG